MSGQPAIVAGRVFVSSDNGYVYALDSATGCVYWSFRADAAVRSSVAVERPAEGRPYAVYFGDARANVYAVDAVTERKSGRPASRSTLGTYHRRSAIFRRPDLCACCFGRRRSRRKRELRMLHVAWQRCGPERRDRKADLEDLFDSRRAQAHDEESDGNAVVGTFRRRCLELSDD